MFLVLRINVQPATSPVLPRLTHSHSRINRHLFPRKRASERATSPLLALTTTAGSRSHIRAFPVPYHFPRKQVAQYRTHPPQTPVRDLISALEDNHMSQEYYVHQTKQKNETWSAVDEYVKSHLITAKDTPFFEELNFALKNQVESGLPDIAVSALQGKFLAIQAKLINAKNILEVGTLGAYSTIWLASSSPDCKVTIVEVDPHNKDVAEKAIANAKLEERVQVLLGPGVEVLPKLREKGEKFDLVFIDADKQNNLNYLNEAVLMGRSGTCIIVDNVVRKGNVADAEIAKEDDRVQGSRRVIEAAGADSRLDATVIQTVGEKNYDGFLLCIVK